MTLQMRTVDPRDIGWEIDAPTFRVDLWRRSGTGWACDERELTGCDVVEALAWVDAHVDAGGIADVWLLVPGEPPGRVHLRGHDPT